MSSDKEYDLFIAFYESARQDIFVRINLRENSMMVFLGAVGALIAASIQVKETTFLLVIPYLTLGISIITYHHNYIISGLINYLDSELGEFLKENKIKFSQWDSSESRKKISDKTRKVRGFGDMILILIPATLALFVNYSAIQGRINYIILFVSGVICLLGSIYFLREIDLIRKETFDELKKRT